MAVTAINPVTAFAVSSHPHPDTTTDVAPNDWSAVFAVSKTWVQGWSSRQLVGLNPRSRGCESRPLHYHSPRCVMGKGNNSQGKEKKKPKKGAKPAPVKTPPPPKQK